MTASVKTDVTGRSDASLIEFLQAFGRDGKHWQTNALLNLHKLCAHPCTPV